MIPVAADVSAVTADGISVGGRDYSAARRFYPHVSAGEGQFLCLMRRQGDLREGALFRNDLRQLSKEELKAAESFFMDTVGYVPERLAGLREDVILLSDGIEGCPAGAFCCGVPVGRTVKGRLVPHHHLFSAYGACFRRKVDLLISSPQCAAYLRGEGFVWEEAVENGWCAVFFDGIPCSGGKIVNGYVKNHYPKGLRMQ